MAHNATPLEKSPPIHRKTVLLAVAALALLIGALLWSTRTKPSHPPAPPDPVNIAVNTRYAGSCAIVVAQENGYFANAGLRAKIQPQSSGKASLDAFMDGRADLGTTADMPVMFAAMNGQPVVVVATLFKAEKDNGIVGRKDHGVVTPASLKGARIGVTLGTGGQFVLDAILNRNRLSAGQATIVDLQPEQLAAALSNGDVDAVATWEPYLGALQAQQAGNGAIFYGDDIYDAVFHLAGTRAYVLGHPEVIKKVLRALIEGAQFCQDAPDAAAAMLARAMNTDAGALRARWPSYRFDVILDQGLVLALEDETRWAIRNKLTAKSAMPNYLNHIYFEALDSVRPAAVTLIH